ncbi:UNVERIFIED_CONTAM: hypothetical protein FKN15_056910 [Acipenser sinensis]
MKSKTQLILENRYHNPTFFNRQRDPTDQQAATKWGSTRNRVVDPPKSVADRQHCMPTRVDPAFPMKELNTSHYPATRAARVAQHYLNYHHGSPSKWFMVHDIKKASSEEIVGNCTAEILFRQTEEQSAPEVNCTCDDLLKIETSDADHALYLHIKHQPEPVASTDIPGKHRRCVESVELTGCAINV